MAPLEVMQAAVLPPAVTQNLGEIVSLGLLLAAKAAQEWWSGRRRESRQSTELSTQLGAVSKSFGERCDGIERQVTKLEHHIVGPDGENGLRGDMREVKKRVIGLEDRERERLTIGAYDRRAGS